MRNPIDPKAEEILVQRFHRDALIAIATLDGDLPAVRNVDGYYEDGSFYVVTYALSNKMLQIAKNPAVAVSGEWFTGRGTGRNIGHPRDPENAELAVRLREAFAAWYEHGHVDENDPHTCILRIDLTSGVLMNEGTRYELTF